MSERAPAPARALAWVAACAVASLLAGLLAWAPALPTSAAPGDAFDLLGGRGSTDAVALARLRLAELARLAVAAAALALLGRRAAGADASAVGAGALAAALLAAAWVDQALGGWPPPDGWSVPLKTTLAAALAAGLAAAAARRDPRAAWGLLLLLLGGLGQQLARPAVELEALRALERLVLGDLTRSLAPLGVAAALAGLAAATRGPLRTPAAAAAVALSAGGLWGLAAWTFLGPRGRPWGLLPLALGAEALSAQVAGWGRLAPGIPGGLAAGLGLLVAGMLGLGRERDPVGAGS